MIRKLIALSLFTSTVYAQVDEQGARTFSLEEAYNYALENGYNVQNKQLEVEKARATVTKALGSFFGQVNAGYDVIWNAQIQPQAIPVDGGFLSPEQQAQFPPDKDFIYLPFGTEHQVQWNVGIDVVNLSYSNFLARRASILLKENKSLDLEDARIQVRNEVEKNYYGVLVAEENVRLLEENLESLNKNFTETRKLYESGFIEEQSVDQLELLVSNLNNNLSNARRQQVLSRMLLKFSMGMPLDSAIELSQTLDSFIYTGTPGEGMTTSFDPKDHIVYRKILSNLEGSLLNVKNERAKLVPSFKLNVTHTEAYFSNEFDPVNWNTYWAPGTRVVGGLAWNVNLISTPATIQEAKVDAMETEVVRQQTYNQLSLNYEQAQSNYAYALENYNTQMRNIEISKKIRDKERVKFKEGISGSLDLTQAENQFLETQQQYVQALLNLLNAKEELDQAMGQF